MAIGRWDSRPNLFSNRCEEVIKVLATVSGSEDTVLPIDKEMGF
jgi:hypothetical protein